MVQLTRNTRDKQLCYHSNTYVSDMAHRDEPEIVAEERQTSTGIW